MSIFPLILIDTHTTGLPSIGDGKAVFPQVLELSAICYEPGKMPEMMDSIQIFIKNDKVNWMDDHAKKINLWLADEIEVGMVDSQSVKEASESFNKWLTDIRERFEKESLLISAGRKVDSFDMPILKYNGFDLSQLEFKGLDITSLFYREDLNWLPTVENLYRLSGGKRKPGSYAMDSLMKCAHVLSKVELLRAVEIEHGA